MAEIAREGKALRRSFEEKAGFNIALLQQRLEALGALKRRVTGTALLLLYHLPRSELAPALFGAILKAGPIGSDTR